MVLRGSPKKTDPIDLEVRALMAYIRTGASLGVEVAYCGTIDDRLYVLVTRFGAAVAVYALRADGRLRRISRWPDCVW